MHRRLLPVGLGAGVDDGGIGRVVGAVLLVEPPVGVAATLDELPDRLGVLAAAPVVDGGAVAEDTGTATVDGLAPEPGAPVADGGVEGIAVPGAAGELILVVQAVYRDGAFPPVGGPAGSAFDVNTSASITAAAAAALAARATVLQAWRRAMPSSAAIAAAPPANRDRCFLRRRGVGTGPPLSGGSPRRAIRRMARCASWSRVMVRSMRRRMATAVRLMATRIPPNTMIRVMMR